MELKIISDNENKVVGRREIKAEINYEQAPPSKQDVLEELAKQLKAEKNLIIIKRLSNVFGLRKMICTANLYADEKTLNKFEPKYLIKRIKKEEKKEGEQ
jgi:ribosomal protein S24E